MWNRRLRGCPCIWCRKLGYWILCGVLCGYFRGVVEVFWPWFQRLGVHGHAFIEMVNLALECEVVLFEDNLKECDHLIGGLYVIILKKLGSGDVDGFIYGNVDINVFDRHQRLRVYDWA